jgi:glycosyltransferase involved in cell wall biosynthesis
LPGDAAPFVSVIVPVLNDPLRVRLCIEALLGQTYPKDRHEIIVVDNGSTDGTRASIARYPVTLVTEARRGSYAARNAGLARARGEVIALTDADCCPVPRWIDAGLQALDAQDADLAGGHVDFLYSRHPSAAEIYDALSNMQQERSIRERQVAKTANLFVRARVFDTIGRFPDAMQSGGDVYWTRQATSRGFRLVYAPDAVVVHPTRRLGALLSKQYRVGGGRYDRYVLQQAPGMPPPRSVVLALGLRSLKPPRWSRLRDEMRRREGRVPLPRLVRVWSVGWLCRLTTALGSASRWATHRANAVRRQPATEVC